MIRTQLGLRNLSDPNTHKEHFPFAVEAAFSGFELKRLREVLKFDPNNREEPAMTTGDATFGFVGEESERKAHQITIPFVDELNWFYEKLEELVFQVNQSVYKYELSTMMEPSIYLRYDGKEGGKYDPHMDMGTNYPTSLRKLSSTIFINDDYEGGELIFDGLGKGADGEDIVYYPKTPGTIVFFPSFLIHRVKPVTKGTRKSIVIWVVGPKFR